MRKAPFNRTIFRRPWNGEKGRNMREKKNTEKRNLQGVQRGEKKSYVVKK